MCTSRKGGKRVVSLHGPDDRARRGDTSDTGSSLSAHVDKIPNQGLTDGTDRRPTAFQAGRQQCPEVNPRDLSQRRQKPKDGSERKPYQRAQWGPEDIGILRRGYARGLEGARSAVRELLNRHGDWTPRTVHYKAYALGLTQANPQRGGANGKGALAWSRDAESVLDQDYGSEWTREIAKKLGRSESAIRSKLRRRQLSSKFRDGLTRDAVVNELHISPRKLQWLIGTGQFRVVYGCIRGESLKQFLQQNPEREIFHKGAPLGVMGRTPQDALKNIERAERRADRKPAAGGAVSGGKPAYTVERVARILEVSREVVKRLVAAGRLKLSSVRIDEEALRRFARTHRSEIHSDLMDEDLLEFYELTRPDGAAADKLPGRVKHTLITRTCPGCRGSFSGNGYATHVKTCPQAAQLDPAVLEFAAEHPTSGTVTEKTRKAWWKRRRRQAPQSHQSACDGSGT